VTDQLRPRRSANQDSAANTGAASPSSSAVPVTALSRKPLGCTLLPPRRPADPATQPSADTPSTTTSHPRGTWRPRTTTQKASSSWSPDRRGPRSRAHRRDHRLPVGQGSRDRREARASRTATEPGRCCGTCGKHSPRSGSPGRLRTPASTPRNHGPLGDDHHHDPAPGPPPASDSAERSL